MLQVPTEEQWQGLIGRSSPSRSFYGTCDTASTDAVKTVICPQFKESDLVAGTRISIAMTNAQTLTEQIQFNVNETGEKDFYTIQDQVNSNGAWSAGQVVECVFDGLGWSLVGPNVGDINTILESI